MKRRLLIALALAATLAFTALGVWQVERRAWKLDLIARVEQRTHATPVDAFRAGQEEYRRVTLTGIYLHDRETLVQALTERGAGFWVLTPMRTPEGLALVNRGFVPDNKTAMARPARAETVTGLLRRTEPGGGFLRANDPPHDRWYSRDVDAIAKTRGLGAVAPFFVDADATPNAGGYPVGGLTVIRFPNNHLVYALTWFGLAALSGFAAVLLLRRKPL